MFSLDTRAILCLLQKNSYQPTIHPPPHSTNPHHLLENQNANITKLFRKESTRNHPTHLSLSLSLSLSLFLVLPTASLTRKALAPLAILIAIVNIPGAHVWAHTHTYMSRDEKESPLCGKPARECGKGARARAVRLADFGWALYIHIGKPRLSNGGVYEVECVYADRVEPVAWSTLPAE